jgi:hypothetical protein
MRSVADHGVISSSICTAGTSTTDARGALAHATLCPASVTTEDRMTHPRPEVP